MSEAPQNVAAERAVLACIFQHGGDFYHDIADIVTTNTMTVRSNQMLWRCCEHVLKDNPSGRMDYPTLMSAGKVLGLDTILSKDSEQAHLRGVIDMPPVFPANGRNLAGQIRKLEIGRLYHSQLKVALANVSDLTGNESIDEIMSKAEQPIFDCSSLLTGAGQQGIVKLGDRAEEFFKYLMDNPRQMMGVSTGFPNYDFAIGGGVRPNSMDVIVARPKSGKSQVLDNMALFIAKNGINVLNVDTEMTDEEHLLRIGANLSGLEVNDIERGLPGFTTENRAKLVEAANLLKQMPYSYISVSGMPFEEVLAAMRRWITRTVGVDSNGKAKPCVIFYDYIKLTSAEAIGKDMSEHQALGFLATGLKNFMGRYGAGCVAFGQQNRGGLDSDATDTVAGSDRILHYCTSLSVFRWKDDEERVSMVGNNKRFTHNLIPKATRFGEGLPPKVYIHLAADFRHGRITEGHRSDQVPKQDINFVDPSKLTDSTGLFTV